MADIKPTLSIITLNLNRLNIPNKRDWKNGKKYATICSL